MSVSRGACESGGELQVQVNPDEGDSLENKRYVIEEEAFEMMASRLSLTKATSGSKCHGLSPMSPHYKTWYYNYKCDYCPLVSLLSTFLMARFVSSAVTLRHGENGILLTFVLVDLFATYLSSNPSNPCNLPSSHASCPGQPRSSWYF